MSQEFDHDEARMIESLAHTIEQVRGCSYAEALDEAFWIVDNCDGATVEEYERRMQGTLAYAFAQLRAAFQDLGIAIGEAIMPYARTPRRMIVTVSSFYAPMTGYLWYSDGWIGLALGIANWVLLSLICAYLLQDVWNRNRT